MVDSLKSVGFEEVSDKTPEESINESFNKIIVECDLCGNTTETCHFFCGEFLPIFMYCIRCKKHVPAHAHYKDRP